MKQVIEYLMLLKLIQYSVLNKEDVNQVITISEEKNETPVIIATIEQEPISSPTEKSILNDVIDEAFKIMDKEYRLIFCQYAVCLYKLDQCEVWGHMPAIYTEERAKKYLYSDSIINIKFKFFYNKEYIEGEDLEYNTLKDLSIYTIGTIPGYWYEQKIKENFPIPFIKWFANEESQLQGLVNGDIQIAPMNEIVGWYYINKNYPNDVEKFGVLDKPLTTEKEEGTHILICKDYPNAEKILDEFNNAIKTLKDTGVIQEILEKYGAEEYIEVSK